MSNELQQDRTERRISPRHSTCARGHTYWRTAEPAFWLIARSLDILRHEGVGSFGRRVWRLLLRFLRKPGESLSITSPTRRREQYQRWRERNVLTDVDIQRMRIEVERLPCQPVISIIMTLSNGSPVWLKKTVESVRSQLYPHWELYIICPEPRCLETEAIAKTCAALDARIKVASVDMSYGHIQVLRDILPLAKGEYVAFLNPYDELAVDATFAVIQQANEGASYDVFYSDEDKIDPGGQHAEPFFKPGWSPDLFLSMDYISRWCVIRKAFLEEFRTPEEDFVLVDTSDLRLHLVEKTDRICHIPKVLYHVRVLNSLEGFQTSCIQSRDDARQAAVEKALRRRGENGRVRQVGTGLLSVSYDLQATPLVSIIIPTKDRWKLLKQCIASIEEKTKYARYEIIIIENGASTSEAVRYLNEVAKKWQVHHSPPPFNYSKINNFGASLSRGEYLLFLNDDTEVLSADWLTAMVAQGQRRLVGAVGAKLLYPNGRIQHAGVVLGIGGVAGHAFRHSLSEASNYFGLPDVARNCSAVTGACMLVSRAMFERVNGFNIQLPIEYNDVDLCLRIVREGYRIVYVPDAQLYHYESATRRGTRCLEDEGRVKELWGEYIQRGDPFYNLNLTLTREDWSVGGSAHGPGLRPTVR